MVYESMTYSEDSPSENMSGEFNIAEGTYQNNMHKTNFQNFREYSRQLIGLRDDLSYHDRTQFENYYYLGVDMLLLFNSYYIDIYHHMSQLYPVSRITHACEIKRDQFNIIKYGLMDVFDNRSKEEKFNLANFAKRNFQKCVKYQMLYPLMDDYGLKKMPIQEKVKDLKERESNLKDLLLREMGVDQSIFDQLIIQNVIIQNFKKISKNVKNQKI